MVTSGLGQQRPSESSHAGRPVKFEITEQTRQAIDEHLSTAPQKPGGFLFPGKRSDRHLSTRQYARLFAEPYNAAGAPAL